MDQAEVDTYKRLNFVCQEQMKHQLKTAIYNEGQTRGQWTIRTRIFIMLGGLRKVC
jgi:hypothetical protein